jgi:predicted RNA-binding Zn-ribbon protein involved in translation (DUF1610 family)
MNEVPMELSCPICGEVQTFLVHHVEAPTDEGITMIDDMLGIEGRYNFTNEKYKPCVKCNKNLSVLISVVAFGEDDE